MFQSIYSLPNKLQNLLQLPSSGQKNKQNKKGKENQLTMSFTDCVDTVPHKSVIFYETPGQSSDFLF